MKKTITLLLGMLTAQQTNALTLHEALSRAYETNPQIKSYQQNFITATQKYPETLSANFLPNIAATSQLSNTKNKTVVASNPAANIKGYNSGLTVQQNIFSGGSSVAAVAATKYSIDAAKIDYLDSEQDFLLKATTAYIDLIVSKEKLEASKAFVISLSKQYEATEEKLRVGEATKTEVAAAKAQKFQAQALEANDTANYLTAISNFKTYFDIDPVDISIPEIPTDLPADFENFEKQALPSHLTLRKIEAQLRSAKNSVRAEAGKLLPSVDLSASTKKGNIQNDFNNLKSDKTNSYSTSITLTIPILAQGGAEHSRVRAVKSQLRKAAYDQEYIRKAVHSALISDWQRLVAAREGIVFTSEAVGAKQLEYEGVKSKYEVGTLTMLDVLKTEKELFDAIVNNISAKEQLIKASFTVKADLAQLTAKHLGLKAKPFDPEQEFRKTKFKVVGF